LIGGVVALISKNGGMQGIVNRVSRFANSVRNGQLATLGMGIIIFFDDYANTLVVGNTMRAVTDKLRISREKLAYIVDSTAAPVSAVAYPNPASDVLNIFLNHSEKINEIKLLNVSGKLIQSYPTNTNQIDISQFENGVYFIEVTTNKGKLTSKFVK
jgi:hypothetical protein